MFSTAAAQCIDFQELPVNADVFLWEWRGTPIQTMDSQMPPCAGRIHEK